MRDSPWILRQILRDTLFAHWRVPPSALAAAVPPPLELDTYDGSAWLGIVALAMTDLAPRELPALPWVSAFPQVNLRTYVRLGDRAGVYFFSLNAPRLMAVGMGNVLGLSYFTANIEMTKRNDTVRVSSERRSNDLRTGFVAEYRPIGKAFEPQPGSLDHWLTERYCAYLVGRSGRTTSLDIHHAPWVLAEADAEIEDHTLADSLGVELPDAPDVLHYSERQDTVAWLPRVVADAPD